MYFILADAAQHQPGIVEIVDGLVKNDLFKAVCALIGAVAFSIYNGAKAAAARKSAEDSKKAATDADVSKDKATKSEQKVTVLQTGMVDYQVQVDKLQRKLDSVVDELAQLQRSHNVLNGDYTRARQLLDEVQQERDNLIRQIATMENRLKELERRLAEKDSHYEEAIELTRKQAQEIDRLKAELNLHKELLSEYQATAANLTEQIKANSFN